MLKRKETRDWLINICLGLLILLFVLDHVSGLSDPINQTLTEYTNLTRADNVLEIVQELNIWVGGLMGVSLLILIFGVSFTMVLFFQKNMVNALLFGLFISTVSAIFLRTVNLVPAIAIFFQIPLLLIAVVLAVVKK